MGSTGSMCGVCRDHRKHVFFSQQEMLIESTGSMGGIFSKHGCDIERASLWSMESVWGFTGSVDGVYREHGWGLQRAWIGFTGSVDGVYRERGWGLQGTWMGFTGSMYGVYREHGWGLQGYGTL